jgi:hypothetical protein
LSNDSSDLSLLAFGIPPAREAESAAGMPKVPKGQELVRLAVELNRCAAGFRVGGYCQFFFHAVRYCVRVMKPKKTILNIMLRG